VVRPYSRNTAELPNSRDEVCTREPKARMNGVGRDIEERGDLCSGVALEIVKDDDGSSIIVERIHRSSQQVAFCRERIL
jgi:hypothetical protein